MSDTYLDRHRTLVNVYQPLHTQTHLLSDISRQLDKISQNTANPIIIEQNNVSFDRIIDSLASEFSFLADIIEGGFEQIRQDNYQIISLLSDLLLTSRQPINTKARELFFYAEGFKRNYLLRKKQTSFKPVLEDIFYQAETRYLEVISLNPSPELLFFTLIGYADFCFERNEMTKAIDLLLKSLSTAPKTDKLDLASLAYKLLAVAEYKSGNIEQAVEYAANARNCSPENLEFKITFIECCLASVEDVHRRLAVVEFKSMSINDFSFYWDCFQNSYDTGKLKISYDYYLDLSRVYVERIDSVLRVNQREVEEVISKYERLIKWGQIVLEDFAKFPNIQWQPIQELSQPIIDNIKNINHYFDQLTTIRQSFNQYKGNLSQLLSDWNKISQIDSEINRLLICQLDYYHRELAYRRKDKVDDFYYYKDRDKKISQDSRQSMIYCKKIISFIDYYVVCHKVLKEIADKYIYNS